MLTGVFRGAKERVATEEQALIELLASRELRDFAQARNVEIGPFVVDHLFPEQSLIVELVPASWQALRASEQSAARLKFLNDMGYAVYAIAAHELRQPQQLRARLLAVLKRS
jgi:very-short-patch-repair endonuclease